MSELYLHSLTSFDPLIGDALRIAGARSIVEIGAEGAEFSSQLADYAAREDARVRCIDPAPSERLRDLAQTAERVELIERYSPEVLADLQDADTYVVDGDHNWHTVSGELRALEGRILDEEDPALIILHDVHWPCARRDQYYAPQRIPEDARQPYVYDGGIVPGEPGIDRHGFRGAGAFAVAEREGGERNGVLTAVEDFLAGHPTMVLRLIPCVFGLGFLYAQNAPWAAELDAYLAPYDRSPLLERLEDNRISLYLQVLRLQDELDRRAAIQSRTIADLRRRVAELEAAVDGGAEAGAALTG
jgi:hypothetical protein